MPSKPPGDRSRAVVTAMAAVLAIVALSVSVGLWRGRPAPPSSPAVVVHPQPTGAAAAASAPVARMVVPVVRSPVVTPAPAVVPRSSSRRLPADAIPNEHVFQFYNRADRAAFVKLARQLGVDVLGELAVGEAVRIRVRDEALLQRLLAEGPRPIQQGHNYVVRPPDDPLLKQHPPEEPYRALEDGLLDWLHANERDPGWGRGVTVALLDTAVGHHPDLNDARIRRIDKYGMDPTGPMSSHGTAVASLIAGSGGVDGVAPSVQLICLPVMNGAGEGDTFTLAQAIVDAVVQGADIINLSLGTSGDSSVLRAAVDHALANNVAIVAATGNGGVNAVSYPAAYEGVVAVGAVDARNDHLYFSNSGPQVDLVAPGFGVEAAWGADQVALFSGTSAATPIVSAAIAVVLSEEPELKPTEAANLLIQYSDDAGAPGHDDAYGAGVLDLARVENRHDKVGVDLVAARPFVVRVAPSNDVVRLSVYAQNRGTATAREVVLSGNVDGAVQESRFQNVAPGQTVTQTREVNMAGVPLPYTLSIQHSAMAIGVDDADPSDNARQTLVTFGK